MSNPASLSDTAANRSRAAQARQALDRLLATVTRRGYYGEAALRLVVKDGTVQLVRESTERDHREPTEQAAYTNADINGRVG